MDTRDEHDITRGMLQTLREANTPKFSRNLAFLNEDASGYETAADSEFGASPESDNNDTIQPSKEEVAAEQSKFSETLGGLAKFNVFNLYPKTGNAVFGGTLNDKIEWQFSLEDTDGPYITTNNYQLQRKDVELFNRLIGYYENWVTEWGSKMASEYKAR